MAFASLEAVVQTVGQDQILVQLPGVSDPQQAERVLGGTAHKAKTRNRSTTFVEQQVRQELLAKQAELRKLVIRQRLKKSGSLEGVTKQVDLFESKGLTGKTSKMPLANLS